MIENLGAAIIGSSWYSWRELEAFMLEFICSSVGCAVIGVDEVGLFCLPCAVELVSRLRMTFKRDWKGPESWSMRRWGWVGSSGCVIADVVATCVTLRDATGERVGMGGGDRLAESWFEFSVWFNTVSWEGGCCDSLLSIWKLAPDILGCNVEVFFVLTFGCDSCVWDCFVNGDATVDMTFCQGWYHSVDEFL